MDVIPDHVHPLGRSGPSMRYAQAGKTDEWQKLPDSARQVQGSQDEHIHPSDKQLFSFHSVKRAPVRYQAVHRAAKEVPPIALFTPLYVT